MLGRFWYYCNGGTNFNVAVLLIEIGFVFEFSYPICRFFALLRSIRGFSVKYVCAFGLFMPFVRAANIAFLLRRERELLPEQLTAKDFSTPFCAVFIDNFVLKN